MMEMITMVLRTADPTWHMIHEFTVVRQLDNEIPYRTITEWKPEKDFSEDQRLIRAPQRIMEQWEMVNHMFRRRPFCAS
jgi:hypothetical protein